MLMSDALKALVKTYMDATSISASALSVAAGHNDKFVSKVLRGEGVQSRKADELAAWLSDHWPDDVEWPTGLPRPIAEAIG